MNMTEQEARNVLRETMSAVCGICHDRQTIEDIEFLPDICACCEAKDKVAQLVMMSCKPVGTREDLESSFEAFWTIYRKYQDANKKRAKTAWMRIKPDEDLTRKIMAAVNEQSQSEQWQRGYVPHAATWLNGEQWNDTLREVSKGKPGTGSRANYAQHEFREEDLEGIFLDLSAAVL